MTDGEKEYHIGDGVYASHDGYQFKLSTDRGGVRRDLIYLDNPTFTSLVNLGREIGWVQ